MQNESGGMIQKCSKKKNTKHIKENKRHGRLVKSSVITFEKTRGQHLCRVVENIKTQIMNPSLK